MGTPGTTLMTPSGQRWGERHPMCRLALPHVRTFFGAEIGYFVPRKRGTTTVFD